MGVAQGFVGVNLDLVANDNLGDAIEDGVENLAKDTFKLISASRALHSAI